MSRFFNYLVEARRNPTQNKKIGLVQALEPYKNKGDYFIQFSDINKLGINPNAGYNTPAGIYAYPLKEIWEDIVNNTIPFASDRKYAIVFRRAHPKLQEVSTYSEYDLKKDIKKLQELYPVLSDKYVEDWGDAAYYKIPISKLWNITKVLSNAESAGNKNSNSSIWKWNKMFRQLGYVGFTDRKGLGIIHRNEPTQAVFFSKQDMQLIDAIENKRYFNNLNLLTQLNKIKNGITRIEGLKNKLIYINKNFTEPLGDQFKYSKIDSLVGHINDWFRNEILSTVRWDSSGNKLSEYYILYNTLNENTKELLYESNSILIHEIKNTNLKDRASFMYYFWKNSIEMNQPNSDVYEKILEQLKSNKYDTWLYDVVVKTYDKLYLHFIAKDYKALIQYFKEIVK